MHQSEPWQDCPTIWKDEKAYMQWLRSQIRRVWSRHPVKIEYKKSRRYKAPVGRNDKEVWVSDCELCGQQSRKCEVDHIVPGGSFNSWNTFTEWARRILWVTFDDLRELCEECHSTVTLSQKLECSFEEALLQKQVIAVCKQPATEVKQWLIDHGYSGKMNTADVRRAAVEEVLRNVSRTE